MLEDLKNKTFWKATAIRAIRTIAQVALGMIGTNVFICDINWKAMLSACFVAGLASVLTSIITGLPEVD
jgi:hypothetical protein